MPKKFHGYIGHIAILQHKNGESKSAKILGGNGLKLKMQSIDGNIFECYHDNIKYIWNS
tara:strand:+ start:537 stop:713 length:177 start_codon:yes stop_codon:yes gene_type:complete